MRLVPADDGAAPLLVLGHGAGAGQKHPWMQRVSSGLAARGVTVATFDFPYVVEGRKVPDRGDVLEAAFVAAFLEAVTARPLARSYLVGGKSMGGRIASQALAKADTFFPRPAGLICFGFPLHPPGKPHQRRDGHLPGIVQPMLFLHGTRDPFGAPEEMRALVDGLPTATLEIIEGGDHSLQTPKRQGVAASSVDHAVDVAAAWIGSRIVPL